MRKITTLLVALLALFAPNLLGQNAWINEIHYDNASTDVNEMIEVVIENPGSYTLSDFQVDLYNGNGGGSYNTQTLDAFTVGSSSGNFTFFYFIYPTNGIQNGAPDGMALSYQGTVITGQFLSYEGTLTATDGPANGMTSTDIGVSESSSTPVGESLQLSGSGTSYSSFTWQPPAAETPGALNNNQTFGGGPLPEPTNYPTAFAASAAGNMIETTWTDATGAQLPSAYVVFISEADDIVPPVDGTPVADDLDLSDGAGAKNVVFGNEMYTFSDLSTTTMYYFAIFPYTNGGADIDFKTDGTYPEAVATTTSVVLYEDFDWSWMAWDTVSMIGDGQVWDRDNSFGIGGSNCALMSGYDNGAQDNEDWLISPRFDLAPVTNPILTFWNACNYSGPDLEVKYSTDYDGNGDPSTATWTDLSANLSTGGWSWVSSGDIDLSGINDLVHIAFVYYSNPTDGSKTWEVDNVMVTGDYPDPAGVVINEIMYNSPGNDEEWIELYNNTAANIDIGGWFVQDNTPTNTPIAIPSGTVLSPGQFYTISIATDGAFPFTPDLDGTGQAGFALNNGGDDVNLFSLGRLQADYVPYDDGSPWPTAPDGNGPSLSLLDPNLDNEMGENWAASLQDVGTPGWKNFPDDPTIIVTSPIGGEVWEQGSTHEITWDTINYVGQIKIELVDTNTWVPQLLVSNLPSGNLAFTWNIIPTQAVGDDYIIRISDLGSGPVGESPNTFEIAELHIPPDIVITEIMYNPPEIGNDSLEFIELYNNGTDAIDMDGFYFESGVTFTFPAVTLNPAEYLIVGINATAMANTFGVTAYEWTSGALSNSGELVRLYDAAGMFVDEVDYDDSTPWDTLADGYGPSLTLCDPSLDNSIADNWAASTEFVTVNSLGDSIWASPMAGCSMIMPTANFKASDTTVLVGGSTDFGDLSTGGTMVSWLWTFEGGDPATSTEQNPAGIMYATQGAYDVTLEVENDFGETSTLTKVDYISVDFAPEADFEADATAPAIGQGVQFTDLSTGTINEWSWTFEGGTPATSMLQTPEPITWAAVGKYDVTLTVTNDYGSDTETKEEYIDVQPIGISELDLDGLIKVYPNPAYGQLNVENATGEDITLSIYTLTGQQIIESRISEGTGQLNLESLEAGIYFVRYVTESHQVKTGKLIIK
jgi:PKD repeat protein